MQESWKTIAGFTALGITGAALYLLAVPKQYEAIAQIKMAQIANVNNNNINPLGINIEEPQALIARMALPTFYPEETTALCGLTDKKDPKALLVKKLKFGIPKGVGGILELTVRDASKEIAEACTNALYQLIRKSQAILVAPYIEEATKKLKSDEERLGRATQVIAKAERSGAAVSAAYLATRDEIRYLLDQITSLQNIITGNESRATHLTTPIYLKEEPVSPQKLNSLLIGLLIGGLLGLAFTLARKWYRFNRAAHRR